jgi:phosphoglycerol transferase MdoB-like AlkP superfamily enzyme
MSAKKLRIELHYIWLLVQRLLIAYLLFSMCRVVFYLYNSSSFEGIETGELLFVFFAALRFDTSSIFYANGLVILMQLFPFSFRAVPWYQQLQKGIFLLCNGIVLLLEVADIAYFQYAFRRLLRNDFAMSDDIQNLLPLFISEFWLLVLFYLGLIFLGYYLYKKTEKQLVYSVNWAIQAVLLLVTGGLTVIGMRGGLQIRPLMPIVASQYVSNTQYMPLVSNTTLGLIHSFQQRTIGYKNYFDKKTVQKIYPLDRRSIRDSFTKKNVVILVCESLGREYIGYFGKGESQTPFLDSLLGEGLNFVNMYANGTRSTQGIVAISGGLPSLMLDPFMFSAYQTNNITGLGTLLAKEGYANAFFHGGEIGTMSFDQFMPAVGVKKYYGRSNYIEGSGYEEDRDYDGNWGIWDLPFYDYALKEISKFENPFFATLFSINVHHPFNVEPWFAQKYPKMDKRLRSIKYADYNLRIFFEKASKEPWFDNTLFVITADHTGPHRSVNYIHREGSYRIPLLLYNPSDTVLKGIRNEVTQQIDIMPTVLGYLGYPTEFKAFGVDKFDEANTQHYSYTFEKEIYQIIGEVFVLQFDGEQTIALYNRYKDPSLKKNVQKDHPKVVLKLERQLKAVIQRHHQRLIDNK